MEKRVSDIVEAFEHCKFQECLRLTDQLLKKLQKGDKKKDPIPEAGMKNVHLCRAGSLAATGQYHIANALLNSEFKEAIVDKDLSFLFLQIVSMSLDKRITQFVEEIENKKEKQKINIHRFILSAKKFSMLGKIFLKDSMTSKKDTDAFGQIYLEYLNEYAKHKNITYSRDRKYLECKEANFKMVSMFLDKFANNISKKQEPQSKFQSGIRTKIKTGIADLKLKISIHEGNPQKSRQLFIEHYQLIKERPFNYLRSIQGMGSQPIDNHIFYIKQYLKIFRNNLNLDEYQPIYDYNEEFLSTITQGQMKLSQPNKLNEEQLYSYFQQNSDQFQNYYDSLCWQYNRNISEEEQLKKKDYYRICNKNILLQLIKICSITKETALKQHYLLEYKRHFGKTLTFYGEVQPFIKECQETFIQAMSQQPTSITKDDDKLIWCININKLYLRYQMPTTMEEMIKIWKYYEQLYRVNVKEVEQLRHLQKGERYISDDFIIIAADFTRSFIERAQLSEMERQQCCLGMIKLLQSTLGQSPYNFDIKLRLMYFCDVVNYYDRIFQIYQTMDIKAVQFQTVGYWIMKAIIQYELWDTHETSLIRIIRSYQENNRESAQYALKAIQHASFNECQEFMCYHDHIENSYTFTILLYILYLKNRFKPQSEFYLKEIITRINTKPITFNCDFKVLENLVDPKQIYGEYFGIFNNSKIIENDCRLKMIIHDLVKKQQSQYDVKDIRCDWKCEDVYDFNHYDYFQRKLNYECGHNQQSQRESSLQIVLYNIITKVKINLVLLCYQLGLSHVEEAKLQQIHQTGEGILATIKQLSIMLSDKLGYRSQTKLIPFARSTIIDCFQPLQFAIDGYSGKSKKKIEGKAQKKELCLRIKEALIDSVSNDVKMRERLPVSKEFMSESSAHQDELLERMSLMNGNEYRKLYKVK